jgi:hypothetical protein
MLGQRRIQRLCLARLQCKRGISLMSVMLDAA